MKTITISDNMWMCTKCNNSITTSAIYTRFTVRCLGHVSSLVLVDLLRRVEVLFTVFALLLITAPLCQARLRSAPVTMTTQAHTITQSTTGQIHKHIQVTVYNTQVECYLKADTVLQEQYHQRNTRKIHVCFTLACCEDCQLATIAYCIIRSLNELVY